MQFSAIHRTLVCVLGGGSLAPPQTAVSVFYSFNRLGKRRWQLFVSYIFRISYRECLNTGHLAQEPWRSRDGWHSYYRRVIIIMCHYHRYPWPFLTTSPYHSSLLAGLQGYIPYPHIAAVCMFELVFLFLLGHMRGSIGVHHWWVRPCFSSSVLHVWFV